MSTKCEHIVNGKIYNTEHAEKIGVWTNGEPEESYHYKEETLYLTDNDNYFLLCIGGCETEYARVIPGGYERGSTVVPFSKTHLARRWAEACLEIDVVKENFNLEEA